MALRWARLLAFVSAAAVAHPNQDGLVTAEAAAWEAEAVAAAAAAARPASHAAAAAAGRPAGGAAGTHRPEPARPAGVA